MNFGKYKYVASDGPGLFNSMKSARITQKKEVLDPKTPSRQFKEQDYVQIKSTKWCQHHGIGINARMIQLARYGAYGQVVDTGIRSSTVSFFTEQGPENYSVANNDLERLPAEQQSAIAVSKLAEQWRMNASKREDEEMAELFKQVDEALAPVTASFEEINFLTLNPQVSPYNQFLETGVMVDKQRYMKYRLYKSDGVADILLSEQDNGDYMLYLPSQWVNVAGYGELEVLEWVEAVKEMPFEVPVEYKGVVTLEEHENYPNKKIVNELKRYGDTSVMERVLNSALTKNEYYKIHLKGCECGMINLLVVKLLTCLYHKDTRMLAGLTLQMKRALGNQATVWQCFLMSLVVDSEQVFSALTANVRNTLVVAALASENSEVQVSNRLSQGVYINQSLAHAEVPYPTYVKLMGYIHDKDFENLLITYKEL